MYQGEAGEQEIATDDVSVFDEGESDDEADVVVMSSEDRKRNTMRKLRAFMSPTDEDLLHRRPSTTEMQESLGLESSELQGYLQSLQDGDDSEYSDNCLAEGEFDWQEFSTPISSGIHHIRGLSFLDDYWQEETEVSDE